MRVEAISTKQVKTKRGLADTFSIKCDDGVWYGLGFDKPTFAKGDDITFDFENTAYGNKIKFETVKINGSAAPSVSKPSGGLTSYQPKAPYTPAASRPFPIPLTHGDRSIVRQNALTNARELVCATFGSTGVVVDDAAVAKRILNIAQMFEEYSAGDAERRAGEAAAKGTK
jgi:hypothetical protein